MGCVSQQSFISAGQAKTNGVDVLEVATRAYSVASPLQGSRIMIETQPTSDSIAITRTFGGIEEAAHRTIQQLGGMAPVLRGAKFALLKPNFVAGRPAQTGSTTSFALLKTVAEEVHACGAEPVLCEIPGTEFDRDATYSILGVEKFCAENGIRIVRVDPEGGEQDWIELRPAGARRLRRLHVPR